jgi:protein TonB
VSLGSSNTATAPAALMRAQAEDDEVSPGKRWALRIGLGLLGLLALWGAVKFVGASHSDDKPQRKPTQITVLRPPPPPPPPPKQEKPPEPPKIKEEVKIDTPKPVDAPKPAPAAEAPPPGPLGVDAAGTGPGDGFGLAGRPGGRDIVLGGPAGGGAANALSNATFGNAAARFLAQELARDGRLRGQEYKVVVNIWVGRDGRIERHELVRGTGNAELDQWLIDGLAHAGPLKAPPEGLPQPMRIRVTSADV